MGNKNKKFVTLRYWNRKRNYLMKDVRYYIRLLVAKLLWDKKERDHIKTSSIKTVLLLRNEGKIGDLVTDTILIKALSKAGYIVDVLVTESNSVVLKHNPYVRNTFTSTNIDSTLFMRNFHHNVPAKTIEKIKRSKHDLVIDPSLFNIPIHRLSLFKKLDVKYVVGFNKPRWIKSYTESISFNYNDNHIKTTSKLVMDFLNIKSIDNKNYDLHYPDEINVDVKKYINQLNSSLIKKKIVINTLAGNKDRCLSVHQLDKIIRSLKSIYNDVDIIFIDPEKCIDIENIENVYRNPFKSLYHTMSLIAHCDLVISPDTSIVHIAAAYRKKMVSIYQDIKSNNTLWGPGYNGAIQILAEKGRLYEIDDINERIIESVKIIFPPHSNNFPYQH